MMNFRRTTKKLFVLILSLLVMLTCISNQNFKSTKSLTSIGQDTENPPYNIIWYIAHTPQKDASLVLEKVNEYLTSKINATLELRTIPLNDYDKKMKAIISSGEEYDLCFTSVWMNSYVHNALKGSFLHLDPLLEKYGRGTLKTFPPILLECAKVKGKIYALPSNKELAHQWCITLNKKFVTKYGFDLTGISKLEDLEPMLKVIKEKEPSIVPYLIYPYSCHAFSMPMERIDEQVPSALYFDNRTNYRLVNPMESPEFKQYLSLMYKWYHAGYILKDAASLKDISFVEKAGNWFAGSASYNPVTESTLTKSLGYHVLEVPLLQPFITKKDIEFYMTAISSSSRNPEKVMMLLELLNTDKYLYNLIAYGIEGIHYSKISENVIEPKSSFYNVDPFAFGNQKLSYFLSSFPQTFLQDFEKFNASAILSPLLGFNFNPEPVKSEIEKITEVTEEFEGPLFVGAVDPDIYLPKVIEKYKAAGLDKVIAEQQKQLDVWLLEKGVSR